MVSILKISRSRFTKFYLLNSQIKDINVNQKYSYSSEIKVEGPINDLISKREAFQRNLSRVDNFKGLTTDISSINPNNPLIVLRTRRMLIRQYMDLIYGAKTEKDLDVIVEFLRLNKKYIFQNHSYPIHLMNLLYILKKPERAFSIFNGQEIGFLFLNHHTVTILLQNLDAHRMYAEVVRVFDKYFPYILNLKKMDMVKSDYISNEQLVLCTKALYNLNSQESMNQFKYIFQRLMERDYSFSSASLMHLTLLGIQQNEVQFVLECIEENENIRAKTQPDKKYKTNSIIIGNLKAILLANMKQIDTALLHLRNLVEKESKNTNLFCIWPTAMDHLRKNCEENDQIKVKAFNNEVRDRVFDSGRDFLPYMEHLTKLATENKLNVKYNEKKQPFQFYKSDSIFSNNEEDYDRKSKKVSLQSSDNVEDQIQRLEFLLTKLDEKIEFIESKYPEIKLDSKHKTATNKSLPQQLDSVSNNSANVKEIKELYIKKKYTMVIRMLSKLLIEHKPIRIIDQMEKNELVNIFADSVSKDKFVNVDQIKFLIELIKSKWKFVLPVDCQFLIAIKLLQLDPYYLLEFLVNCDELQASHFSLYQNIMIISLMLNGKTDIALDQIDNILATSVSRHENSFDGKIFQETIKVLNDIVSRNGDRIQANRLKNISLILSSNKKRLIDKDLLSIYRNVFQYNPKKIENKAVIRKNRLNVIDKQISPDSISKAAHKNNRHSEPTNLHEKVSYMYVKADYSNVIDLCEKILEGQSSKTEISDSIINAYTLSVLKNPDTNFDRKTKLIQLLKNKWSFPISTENKIYNRLVELEPSLAVEFLNNGSIMKEFPNLYKNLLSIGLCLTDRLDEALDKIELILGDNLMYDGVHFQKHYFARRKVSVYNDNIYQGKLFKKTNETLKAAISNSKVSPVEKERFEKVQNILNEQPTRIISRDPFDITHKLLDRDDH